MGDASDCTCGPGGSWSCCCAAPHEDEEEIWRRRKKQQLLQSLKRVKGLSPRSRMVLRVDPDFALDDLEQKLFGSSSDQACPDQCRRCSSSFCLLVWLGMYAGIMLTFQLRLYTALDLAPFPSAWSDARSWLRTLERDYFTQFHAYYTASIGVMLTVMTLAFVSARNDLGKVVEKMTRRLVHIAQDEMRTEIRDAVDRDFYAFINRLPHYFAVSSDLTKYAVRRLHRQFHGDLDARTSVLDYDIRGPLAIHREVQRRIRNRMCCWSFLFFFMPWCVTLMANVSLVMRLYVLTYTMHHEVQVQKPQLMSAGDYRAAFDDEGVRFIGYALLVNFVAWVYLATIQLQNVIFCFINSLYPRICIGIASFCDRLLSRTWEETVLSGLTDYIEDVRANVEFSEEEIRFPIMQRWQYESERRPPPRSNGNQFLATGESPTEEPVCQAHSSKIKENPAAPAILPIESSSRGLNDSDRYVDSLYEPLVNNRAQV